MLFESPWLRSKTAKQHMFSFQESFTFKPVDPAQQEFFIKRYQQIKSEHLSLIVKILNYLNFKELLFVSIVNRKFYIASGDLGLLKQYSHKKNSIELQIPQPHQSVQRTDSECQVVYSDNSFNEESGHKLHDIILDR